MLKLSKLNIIDSNQTLIDACQSIMQSPIIAVDVEHCSKYSYLGNTSLIQITDYQGSDYIIDVLKITKLQPLRHIFADQKILKIFHGAAMSDIFWL